MKRYLIILLSLIALFNNNLNAQNWQWAKHIGSAFAPYNERAKVISDGNNNYTIGTFGGTLFLPNDTMISNGNNDIFIAKYDQSGNEIWTKQLGGNNNSFVDWESISGVYDPSNLCIYIAGSFFGNVTFGSGILLTSIGSNDIFIAKIDLNGNCIWAKRAGSVGRDNAQIYISPLSNIYLVAQVDSTANFDGYTVTAGGCIVRYDKNGNCIAANYKYNSLDSNNIHISFIENDLIVYGSYANSVLNFDTTALTSNGSYDFFFARTDSNANVKWIKHYGENGLDGLSSLAIDGNNNIYAPVVFQNTITIEGQNFTCIGSSDMLLLKYDESGNLLTHKQISSGGFIYPLATLSDIDGQVYISGYFSGTANLGNITVSANNPYDFFLVRFDNQNNCLGVRNFTGGIGSSLTNDNNGNIICCGGFQNTINIGINFFTSLGTYDIFLTKIDAITGIHGIERHANNQLIIYANPTAGKCNITVPDDFLHEKNLTLSIYANDGKLIQQKNLQTSPLGGQGAIRLNLEAEAKGIYNVTLSNGVKSYSGKIVFE